MLISQMIVYGISHYTCWSSYIAPADLPPSNGNSPIPTLTAYISFLLWELIFGRPSVSRSTSWSNADFTDDCVWDLTLHLQIILHCTCRSTTLLNGDFTDSDSSYFIPTLRAQIWQTRYWQIYPLGQMLISQMIVYGISHCTCRSCYIAPADLPPCWMVISQIPALTAHISFLLWELIFGRSPPWKC